MERYHVAAAQAKAKGDQRKARMHERIVKVCRGPDKCSPELSGPPNTSVPCSNTKTPSEPTRQAELWMWQSCPCPQVGLHPPPSRPSARLSPHDPLLPPWLHSGTVDFLPRAE